jgi:peptidoglycan/LPS O-acetylase OafA/YrhL
VSDSLWWLVSFFGGALVGGTLALLFGTSRKRVAILLALGVILGAAYVLAAYLSARLTPGTPTAPTAPTTAGGTGSPGSCS